MTEEQLQQRIDAYCAKWKVSVRKADGLPPFPAGERETRKHRDWVVLYKAVSRFRQRRAALPMSSERAAAMAAQDGRCPICLAELGADAEPFFRPGSPASLTIVHAECDTCLRFLLRLGPSVLERLQSYAWPDALPSVNRGKVR
jgi:hypothetical protein